MKRKIGFIVLAIAIILIIVGVVVWKIQENKKHEEVNNNYNNVEQISNEIKQEIKNDILVEYIPEDTWQDGDSTATKYLVKISNNSKTDKSNWKVIFDVATTTKISQFWNVNLELSDSKLIASPVEYNGVINKENKIEFGMILKDNNKQPITGYKLFLDGTEYVGKVEEKVENKTEQQKVEEPKKEVEIPNNETGTPVDLHGRLSVNGTKIVDKTGNSFIIQGVSTHGIAWFPQYINYDTFKTLRDDFNVNTIRLAMYSDRNAGYEEALHEKVSAGVEYAKSLGMYVIIDWHILNDNNPNQNKEAAKAFFTEMANKYKDYDNVLYEICNEPNGNVTWSEDIKPYAEELIDLIREIDDKAIIIVGTPTWSQDVDIASENQITGYNNIVYTLHYYAATHKENLRNKLKTALDNNLPVFVSEFGICDASGNGSIDEDEANKWISYLRENGIGYVCWNLSNKNESSALLKSSTDSISNWTDDELSQEGIWLKNTYKNIS